MVTRKRIYIAGPIAGKENGNREAFAARAEQLRIAHFEPVNPWDIPPDHPAHIPCVGHPVTNTAEHGHGYGCFLREDLAVLVFCDGYTLLDGWEDSVGATTEEHVARSIGLPLIVMGE